uniref:Uncharacterized protein n=1 Tax=Neobodo designis TaxID=312471 RepID=A0A7S1QXF1_NEODS
MPPKTGRAAKAAGGQEPVYLDDIVDQALAVADGIEKKAEVPRPTSPGEQPPKPKPSQRRAPRGGAGPIDATASGPAEARDKQIVSLRATLKKTRRQGLPQDLKDFLQRIDSLSDRQVTSLHAALQRRARLRARIRAFVSESSPKELLDHALTKWQITPDDLPASETPVEQLQAMETDLTWRASMTDAGGDDLDELVAGEDDDDDADGGPPADARGTPASGTRKAGVLPAMPATQTKFMHDTDGDDDPASVKQSVLGALDEQANNGAKRKLGADFVREYVNPLIQVLWEADKTTGAGWTPATCTIHVGAKFIDAIKAAAGSTMAATRLVSGPLSTTLTSFRENAVFRECTEHFLKALDVAAAAPAGDDGLRLLPLGVSALMCQMIATLAASVVVSTLQEEGPLEFPSRKKASQAITGFLVARTSSTKRQTVLELAKHVEKLRTVPFDFHGVEVDYGESSAATDDDSDSTSDVPPVVTQPTAVPDERMKCSKCKRVGHRRSACPQLGHSAPPEKKRPLDDFHAAASAQRAQRQPRRR